MFKPIALIAFLALTHYTFVYADDAYHKHPTHRMLTVGRRDTRVEVFHPETTFETFGTGLEQPAAFGELDLPDAAIDFVTSHLGVDESQVTYKSGLQAETTKAAYVNQVHNGISFVNAVANVAWKDNKVVSFGSSFVNNDNVAPSEPSISLEAVIPAAEELLDGKYNGHPATLEYLVQSDGFVALVHVLQIQNEVSGTWYEAFVDAHSGEILSVTDFVSDALYVALPITKQTLPEGLELLLDPQDIYSSPSGWHDDGKNKTNSTSGNNVVAYKGTQPNVTFQSGPNLAFNYTYSDKIAPTSGQNIDAARTNAFYIVNTVHDFAYRYGFTEAAFNFQNDNFDRGGVGHDRVLMSVQDSSGYNNANFGTPAEYVWTYTRVGCSAVQQDTLIYEHPQVRRDGSLENDIVVHELTHGITNRMTGGGTARCLQTIEARGMGEGWSDAMAEWTEQTSATVKDYVLGQYVIDNPKGIRNYPYSTNATVNPLRYSSIAKLNEVHNIGEVWANLLHNIYAALVQRYGFSPTAKTNPGGTEGNIVFLHLFMDALILQPCNPSFVSARDAWLQADVNRYSGANSCLLWKVFASRGLGVNAAKYVDSSLLPPACTKPQS